MWALVTGGAKRLGANLCLALAEKGYSIAVHYRSSHQEALAVVKQCQDKAVQAIAIQGDFDSSQGVQQFIQHYLEQIPDTHLLVNNVGNYLIRSAMNTTVDEWNLIFQVNLHAPFLLTQALVPSLIRNKGQIINIGTSGLHRHSANTYASAYTLSKNALWDLTRSLACELASKKVRVNMVSPGQLEISIDLPHDISVLPMKRAASCSEVARVVTFLTDSASEYITGQNIEVTGGVGLL